MARRFFAFEKEDGEKDLFVSAEFLTKARGPW